MKKVTLEKRPTLQKERTDRVVLTFVKHFDRERKKKLDG